MFPFCFTFSPHESTHFIITNFNNAKGLKSSNLGSKTHKWYYNILYTQDLHTWVKTIPCNVIHILIVILGWRGMCNSATSFFFFSITFDSDISFQRPIRILGFFFSPSITRGLAFCFKQLQWEIFGNYTTNWLKNMLTKERHKRQS